MDKLRNHRTTVTGKFLLILLFSAVFGIFCFSFLYGKRDSAYFFLYKHGILQHDRAKWIEEFTERAKDIVIEPDKQDLEALDKITALCDLRDYYSGIIIYNSNTGQYITSFYPKALDDNLLWRLSGTMSSTYQMEMDAMTTINRQIAFQDQVGDVYFFSYHNMSFYPWYLGCSLILSILLFLTPILWFLQRKMREIKALKNEILYMAEGNLERSIPAKSGDEIGILARQLDFLRKSLGSTIQSERESRQANSDLIRAMSHDLRTPLTILTGYLEILKLHRGDAAMQEQYLDYCLHKVMDIRELSDRMFEYALVYETQEELSMEEIPISALLTQLGENMSYIELAGFSVISDIPAGFLTSPVTFSGNLLALKRVLNNLFSNILKYGEKGRPVTISFGMEHGHWHLSLVNHVKTADGTSESNHIGLKSAEKILKLHGGSIYFLQESDVFSVEIQV